MLENIFTNIIASVVCAVIAAMSRAIYQNLVSNHPTEASEKANYSKKLVHRQFVISLAVLAISLPIACLLPPGTSTGAAFLKIFLFMIAGFSFIFAWGAFDAAFSFYPDDCCGQEEPPDPKTDKTTDRKSH